MRGMIVLKSYFLIFTMLISFVDAGRFIMLDENGDPYARGNRPVNVVKIEPSEKPKEST